MNPLLVSTAETAEKVLDVDNGLPKPAVKISVLLVLLQLAAPLGPAKMLPAPTQTFSTDPEKPDESASDKSSIVPFVFEARKSITNSVSTLPSGMVNVNPSGSYVIGVTPISDALSTLPLSKLKPKPEIVKSPRVQVPSASRVAKVGPAHTPLARALSGIRNPMSPSAATRVIAKRNLKRALAAEPVTPRNVR
jgi:hypothetical protein